MSDFHFALARITAAQICRACGIERCSRGVLEVLTDVLIKYLMLLGSASATALELRNACDASAADALFAASQYDAIRAPGPDGVDDIIDLMRWLKGPVQQRLVRVARPQKQGASLLGAAQGAALAALPSSAAAAAAAAENGKATEKPSAALSAAPGAAGAAGATGAAGSAGAAGAAGAVGAVGATGATAEGTTPLGPTAPGAPVPGVADSPNDWLKAVLNQQMLMGNRNKFRNTPLGAPADVDPTIWADDPRSTSDQ